MGFIILSVQNQERKAFKVVTFTKMIQTQLFIWEILKPPPTFQKSKNSNKLVKKICKVKKKTDSRIAGVGIANNCRKAIKHSITHYPSKLLYPQNFFTALVEPHIQIQQKPQPTSILAITCV